MTMPPTTIPIATTAGTTLNRTLVRLFQKLINASDVSMEKLSSSLGLSRCATRIASCARAIASLTIAASGSFTEMVVVWRRPYIDSKVVKGSITKPSNDWPRIFPFRATTPTIVNRSP